MALAEVGINLGGFNLGWSIYFTGFNQDYTPKSRGLVVYVHGYYLCIWLLPVYLTTSSYSS